MTQKERLTKRNAAVRKYFDQLVSKYPHWRIDAIIGKVEDRYFISARTIEAIIKKEAGYDY